MPSAERCSPSVGLRRQLPRKRWSLLVCFTGSQIKPALKGEVDASKASRRRGYIGAALVFVNPSVKPSVCQLPGRGAFLGALYKLLHSLGGPPMTAPTLHIINLWQKHGDAQRPPQLHNLLRSPAVRRISHGAAIFHIAQAVIIRQTGDIQLMPNVN